MDGLIIYMQIIIIAGLYRSGSTWMFNAVKELLCLNDKSIKICNDPNNIPNCLDTDYLIIKTHEYDQLLKDKSHYIFTSYRKLSEYKESLSRFMGEEIYDDRVTQDYQSFMKWDVYSNYCMKYNDLITNKKKVCNDLAKVLELPSVSKKFITHLEKIKPSDKNFDEDTLYYKSHITSLDDN